jgi:hypothetical protein
VSEERTGDLQQKYATQPTIQTVLERLAQIEERLNVRLDRIESLGNTTRGEMLALRADFTELRGAVKEHFPEVVK